MKHIAIVSVRCGSKGLPHKNILPLYGKPLVTYSVGVVLPSGLFDMVYVSTDDEQYAKLARNYGADGRGRVNNFHTLVCSLWHECRQPTIEVSSRAVSRCFIIYVLLVPPLSAGYMVQPGTDKHKRRIAVRKAVHHTGTAADLPVQPLNDIVGADPNSGAQSAPLLTNLRK